MIGLRVLADNQRKFEVLELLQKFRPPCCCALWAWRKIASFAGAGEAKAHWQNGDTVWAVEGFRGYAHPIPKTIAAGVGEKRARFMNPSSGRLSCYKNAGFWMKLNYRTRAEGQMLGAYSALAYFAK